MYKEKVRVCPKCKKEYSGYPAVSRRKEYDEICPECGVKEAMEDFENFRKRSN